MALTWIEDTEGSRSATIGRLGRRAQSTYIKRWKLFGSSDDLAVHAEVNVTLWSQYLYFTYPGQPLNRLHAESYRLEYLGDEAWQLEATYTSQGAEDDQEQDPLKRSRSFETGGATQHITQGLAENRYGTNAPNQQGAIAVSSDSVNGVDIVVPQLNWTETYDVPHRYVTTDYVKTLHRLTGTVNDDTFRGFAAGEVLFLGGSGSQQWDEDKGDGPWSLSYKFAASPNAGAQQGTPALTIGSISGIEKKGHEYLWILYENDVNEDTLIKKPQAVYVNQVYRETDFADLGIGVT